MIRCGTRIYFKGGFEDPEYEGFTPIVCLTKSTAYGELGPYVLTNDRNQLLENIWQGSKLYESVPATKQNYSRFDKTIIWNHPAEVHIKDGSITDKMIAWRNKLLNNKYPVRFPVGKAHRSQCLGSITQANFEAVLEGKEEEFKMLDYITARKEIYWKEYYNAVVKQSLFRQLKKRLENGENLLIIEVDGPIESSLPYYMQKYGVEEDFIVNRTVLATEYSLKLLLNDSKHPWGHGYALAAALLEIDLLKSQRRIVIKKTTKKEEDKNPN